MVQGHDPCSPIKPSLQLCALTHVFKQQPCHGDDTILKLVRPVRRTRRRIWRERAALTSHTWCDGLARSPRLSTVVACAAGGPSFSGLQRSCSSSVSSASFASCAYSDLHATFTTDTASQSFFCSTFCVIINNI